MARALTESLRRSGTLPGTSMELIGAQAIAYSLRALGVHYVFALPGTGVMQALDALGSVPEIQVIVTRQGQIAGHMADGFSRVTGEPSVVMVSGGSGAVNTLSAVICAWPACSPVVVIAGQAPTSWQGREAFEEVDLVAMFQQATKYAFEMERSSTIPETLRRAFKEATTGRPGPVLIAIPSDLASERADFAIHEGRYRAPMRVRPDAGAVERAAALLLAAERPAIFAGGGICCSRAYTELEELADLVAIPVIPTSETDVLRTASPLYVRRGAEYVENADVLLAVGCRFSEFSTEAWTLLKEGVRLIHLDIDSFQIEKVYPTEVGLVADAKAGLADLIAVLHEGLAGRLDAHVIEERRRQIRMRKAEIAAAVWPEESETDFIRPWQVVRAMRSTFADDVYLVEDTATLGAWVERCFEFREPGTHLRDIGGTMGFMAAAAGVKLACPEREVVAFTGDGAFMMVDSVISTMARHQLGVLTIIWNNNAFMQTGFRYPRVPGNALHNPDFAELSRAMGAYAERVEAPAELLPALRRALDATKSSQPAVVEVLTTSDPKYATPGSYYGRTPVYKSGTPPPPETYYSTPIRS